MSETKDVCVVAGVGPGIGAALARRFASAGYPVALLARTTELSERLAEELPKAKAYACDVGDAAAVERAYAAIRADLGAIGVLAYNAGSGVFANIEAATAEDFERAWRVNTFGAFLASKQVIPEMVAAGRGSIVFIGATASRKGGARTPAFAAAKFGQRGLAESMARHLGPRGVHVAVVVVDGVVDLARTRAMLKDKPDSFFIRPDDVAATALHLAEQPRSAWSFEVEARPFGETW
jgi:NAD(P)-dependent dehydrogenase (short-subunit alcohol dehydrogenase family)